MKISDFIGEYTVEWCSNCCKEHCVPAWTVLPCPTCGEPLVPCSVCTGELSDDVDCGACPYQSIIKAS